MKYETRERHSLRSDWNFATLALGLLMAFMGVAGILAGDFPSEAFLIVPFLALGGWVSVRAPFMGVRVDEKGLRYRGIFRFASVPWAEVDSLTVAWVGNLLVAEMPVVRKKDGKELLLPILAGYTRGDPPLNRRVRAQLLTMERVRAGAAES
ncbi:hypothetical protein [Streptomyces sp. NPDC058486]|uniref:hypothetical protein n=1 Tax=unclassified Streptomyces TaxID=2593676 RepID=UPI00364F7F91